MEHRIVHDELKLFCPDGFHFMDADERARLRFLGADSGVSLSDPERHMLVSIGWTRFVGVSALLFNDHALAKKTEADIRKGMLSLGYQSGGFLQRSVGGRIMEGFAYTYTAQGIAMYGETCALKTPQTLYYFQLYARDALREESLPVWEALLADAEWLGLGLDVKAKRFLFGK